MRWETQGGFEVKSCIQWQSRGSGGNISEAVISLVEVVVAGVTYAGDGVGEGRASLVTRGRGLWRRWHSGGDLGHQALAIHGPLRGEGAHGWCCSVGGVGLLRVVKLGPGYPQVFSSHDEGGSHFSLVTHSSSFAMFYFHLVCFVKS